MIEVIQDIDKLQKTDRILLDANACLFIFGPSYYRYQDQDRAKKYINSQNNWVEGNVYICLPALSEFVNKCRDYYWKIWKNDEKPPRDNNDKKAFRKSSYYRSKGIGTIIVQRVNDLIDVAECCDSEFDESKAREFLSEFEKGKLDFNDIIIKDICEKNGLALTTDDGDFRTCGIKIFTANK